MWISSHRDSRRFEEKMISFLLLSFMIIFRNFCLVTASQLSEGEIRLFLYFPDQTEPVDIQLSDLVGEKLDTNRKFKIIIHGWNSNKEHISVLPVRNAYLAKDVDNVVMADWQTKSYLPYDIARQFVPQIGIEIGKILENFMQKMEIPSSSVHVIGHSLGAHIAGNVGKYFKGKLDRITALDPAGPGFRSTGLASFDAVSSNDAQFVDVIHTAAGSLGEITQRGVVDFYPNRGFNPQPGCHTLDLATSFSCSHFRAPLFFAESILVQNNFQASECSENELMNSIENCEINRSEATDRNITVMGEDVDRSASGIYYLKTNSVFPYGKGASLRND